MVNWWFSWQQHRKYKKVFQKTWPNISINTLIDYDQIQDNQQEDKTVTHFVVFLDYDGKIDYRRDEQFVKATSTKEDEEKVDQIYNQVNVLETRVSQWPTDLQFMIKNILGNALVHIFQKDEKGAQEAIKNATDLINEKSSEVSRYWLLQISLCLAFAAIIGGCVIHWKRAFVVGTMGSTFYILSLCFSAGILGALLSIIMRLGSVPCDAKAQRRLHYAEGIARIFAGGLSGILVGALVIMGIILSLFNSPHHPVLAACVAALVSGASERLAPSIISKAESNVQGKPDSGVSSQVKANPIPG